MTVKELGWVEETTEGTENITTVPLTATLRTFGIIDQDRPHPWEDFALGSVFEEGKKAPGTLVPGMKNVKFELDYAYQHGWGWNYALGNMAHISGSGDTNLDRVTLGTIGANPIKSRSVYSRLGSNIIEAHGCKTNIFSIHAEVPKAGEKPKPILVHEELWGWGTAAHAEVVPVSGDAVIVPPNLKNVYAKGVENMVLTMFDQTPVASVRKFDVFVKNVLAYHGGIGSQVPRGIEQLEGTSITVAFVMILNTAIAMDNTILTDIKAAFSPGTTNQFKFRIKYDAATYYDEILVNNLYFNSVKPIVYKGDIAGYSVAGTAMADGTNEPITVDLKDGVDYTP